jgi:cytochrome c biogenesis protein CcmG, thiol:disulfide interchange protein DsbE
MSAAAGRLTAKNLALLVLLTVALACGRETSNSALGSGNASSRPFLTKKAKQADPRTVAGPEVGNLMPPYTAQWLDGKPFDLAAERGHVVFLNLWATWCGPCRAEMPYLQSLQDQYGARGLKVIGISLDEGGVAGVSAFMTAQRIRYPSAIDADGRIANVLQTTVLPTSVLIDRTGHIVWKDAGMLTGPEASLAKALEQTLAK